MSDCMKIEFDLDKKFESNDFNNIEKHHAILGIPDSQLDKEFSRLKGKYPTRNILHIHYAMTQNNLGVAYSALSTIKDKKTNLELAIKAYKEALKIRTPESVPFDYARTQNNLGIAYLKFSKIENKEYNLKLSKKSFDESEKYKSK